MEGGLMWDLLLQKRILSTERRQSFDEKPWGKNGQVKDTSPPTPSSPENGIFLLGQTLDFDIFACVDLVIFGFISFLESNKIVFYDRKGGRAKKSPYSGLR
ncbi:hypothetical protein CDAR_542471 [Caerostris darwini]|uniref:Uncharacterized protein n=1 Tax=Caerostris darwini TaxID=1538125 RepID=A0AAV4RV81_9ARAC|nr:hypothetical protein CDAR_542471 [Caerostris darwini]